MRAGQTHGHASISDTVASHAQSAGALHGTPSTPAPNGNNIPWPNINDSSLQQNRWIKRKEEAEPS